VKDLLFAVLFVGIGAIVFVVVFFIISMVLITLQG
jgi:hypothetical protein